MTVALGDVRDTVLVPERCDDGCCGLDGRTGLNLARAECGQAIAILIDDCSLWQVVWLVPRAVRPLLSDAPARRLLGWEEWLEKQSGTPPVEPSGAWSPRWDAAVGAALAHLLAASAGERLIVLDGLVAEMFRPAPDALLPSGTPTKHLSLTGSGLVW
ncbi:hypothetical protein [Nonomuraea africana]|uniref:hypothetical protein n=1 Tax=Nonomuraea africana TaxID=46171 RepID=UPI0033D726E2